MGLYNAKPRAEVHKFWGIISSLTLAPFWEAHFSKKNSFDARQEYLT